MSQQSISSLKLSLAQNAGDMQLLPTSPKSFSKALLSKQDPGYSLPSCCYCRTIPDVAETSKMVLNCTPEHSLMCYNTSCGTPKRLMMPRANQAGQSTSHKAAETPELISSASLVREEASSSAVCAADLPALQPQLVAFDMKHVYGM